jgi:CheY-like chemotaxis protein
MKNKTPLIVIVDDSDDDIFFLTEAISNSSLKADLMHLSSGEQAIGFIENACKVRKPDFILLDLKMPKVTGFDVLKYQLENPDKCGSKIIVLSTSNAPKDLKEAKSLGAYDYLIKPNECRGILSWQKNCRPTSIRF